MNMTLVLHREPGLMCPKPLFFTLRHAEITDVKAHWDGQSNMS